MSHVSLRRPSAVCFSWKNRSKRRRAPMNKDKEKQTEKQESEKQASNLERACYEFLHPLLVVLDECVDRRLVVTFLSLVMVVIMHRHRNQGLLLSELGGYLKPASQAPAGTKRISKLLHS